MDTSILQAMNSISESGAADLSWPYLVPLKPGTIPRAAVLRGKTWRGRFIVSPGDTIYCMRKGTVTAMPDINKSDFRISSPEALEILHADGTVMTYAPLLSRSFVNAPGSTVLPGEPVGVATDSGFVWVNLVEFMPGNNLNYPPVRYATGESSSATFEGIIDKIETVHPVSVTAKEKTKERAEEKGKVTILFAASNLPRCYLSFVWLPPIYCQAYGLRSPR